jgi:hypothetical protein
MERGAPITLDLGTTVRMQGRKLLLSYHVTTFKYAVITECREKSGWKMEAGSADCGFRASCSHASPPFEGICALGTDLH